MYKRLMKIMLFTFRSVVLAVDEAVESIHEELRELLQSIETVLHRNTMEIYRNDF